MYTKDLSSGAQVAIKFEPVCYICIYIYINTYNSILHCMFLLNLCVYERSFVRCSSRNQILLYVICIYLYIYILHVFIQSILYERSFVWCWSRYQIWATGLFVPFQPSNITFTVYVFFYVLSICVYTYICIYIYIWGECG